MTIRLEQAQEQARKLEAAISATRAEYADVDPGRLAAFLGSMVDELKIIRSRIDEALGVTQVEAANASALLRLKGGRIGPGKAPAATVTKVIEAVQIAVRQLAAFHLTAEAATARVRRELSDLVGLQVSFQHGSLEILVQPEMPQLGLGEDEALADIALAQFFAIGAWAEGGQTDAELERILPDPVVRRQALNRLRDLAPAESSAHESVEISGSAVRIGGAAILILTPRSYAHASSFLQRRQREHVAFDGQLVVIDVEQDFLQLRYKDVRLRCVIPERLKEKAKAHIEQFVRIEGEGVFIGEAELPSRIEVDEIRPLVPVDDE